MRHFKINTKGGFITYIIFIVAIIILIAYFRTDIQRILNLPAVKGSLLIAIGWIQQGLLWIVAKLGWTSSQLR